MDATLLEHYKNTDYWFVVNGQKITLSVGSTNSDFDLLCRDVNCKTGAFITAFNPHSSLLSFMVLGLSQQTVIDLARRYQQNAFLWIEHQQAAVLIDV